MTYTIQKYYLQEYSQLYINLYNLFTPTLGKAINNKLIPAFRLLNVIYK